MKRIERKRGIDNSGNTILDLQISKTSDLPTLGGKLEINDTITVGAGSCAEIIQTGKVATLDDDGKWYADGAEV